MKFRNHWAFSIGILVQPWLTETKMASWGLMLLRPFYVEMTILADNGLILDSAEPASGVVPQPETTMRR